MFTKTGLTCLTAMTIALASFEVQALPISHPLSGSAFSDVTPIAGGCGVGWHRGPAGICVRNVVGAPLVVAPAAPVVVAPAAPVVVAPRVCPRGFRLTRRGVCVRI